jgi:hypothetical protein
MGGVPGGRVWANVAVQSIQVNRQPRSVTVVVFIAILIMSEEWKAERQRSATKSLSFASTRGNGSVSLRDSR